MFTQDELSAILYPLVTGLPAHAVTLVQQSESLTEDQRVEMAKRLAEPSTPAEAVAAVGDTLRAWGASRDLVNECYRAAFYASPSAVALAANPLFAHFLAKKGGLVLDKWPHYFPIYDRYLAARRGTDVRVLEVGVYRGGGLDLLRDYLGESAVLVGIDIDPIAAEVASVRHQVELGDQTDVEFLARVWDKHGPFDVVIDDGGHTMEQQIGTARALLPRMQPGSIYLVEDTHTSYWPEYGGGRGEEGTFLEWAKELIDEVNAYHWSTDIDVDHVGAALGALHVHDSVVVVEVGRPFTPFSEVVGAWDFLKLNRPLSAVHSELVATCESATQRSKRLAEQLARSELARQQAQTQLAQVRGSSSWRLTAPLRRLRRRGRV